MHFLDITVSKLTVAISVNAKEVYDPHNLLVRDYNIATNLTNGSLPSRGLRNILILTCTDKRESLHREY